MASIGTEILHTYYKTGYIQAIDDFVETVRRKFPDDRNAITNLEIIAEQLKAGDVDA